MKIIVLLKTNNLSLCINREYSKSVLQKKILKNDHRKLCTVLEFTCPNQILEFIFI
jgi:hypothetical protein